VRGLPSHHSIRLRRSGGGEATPEQRLLSSDDRGISRRPELSIGLVALGRAGRGSRSE
jgi:hypothetical protein